MEWASTSPQTGCEHPIQATRCTGVIRPVPTTCSPEFDLSSVQFNHSVVSDSLRPHGLQHARPPCPSPTPGVYSSSCPLSRWCHPTISSSDTLFSSCFQSFPASESFPWVSCSHQLAKVLELQLQYQSFQQIFRLISFRTDLFDLLAVQGTLKSLLQHHSLKA